MIKTPKMKVRDSHATINGDTAEFEMPSGGVDIIAEDGRTLFSLTLDDNQLRVSVSGHCKQNGAVLEDTIFVVPKCSNVVHVGRFVYTL